MKTLFKTSYDQDIDLFEDGAHRLKIALLILAAACAPLLVSEYILGELTYVLIWALAGLGVMLLSGHTGQPTLGHGAFLACGAYCQAWLYNQGMPFVISFPLSGLFAGAVGALIAIPALRMSGIYLAIATLAFGVIVEDMIVLLAPITGGIGGTFVDAITIAGISFDRWEAGGRNFYWLCLGVVVGITFLYANLLRSPTGRAFTAIRDSEVSARAMGVNVAGTKTLAFGLSCFITGLAGALLAHFLGAFNYEAFLVIISILLLLMVTIGGLGSIHGAFFGAILIGMLPQVVVYAREFTEAATGIRLGNIPGLDYGIFALILVAFIIIEPMGIYGRWLKIRIWFELFPLYRKGMFRRNRTYLKTERMR